MIGEQEATTRLEAVMDYFKMLSLYLLEMTVKSNAIFGLLPRECATGYQVKATVKIYPCADIMGEFLQDSIGTHFMWTQGNMWGKTNNEKKDTTLVVIYDAELALGHLS